MGINDLYNKGLKIIFSAICLWAIPIIAYANTSIPADRNAAVIFTYHRIGADQYPDENIRLSQFNDHLKELSQEPYNVLPLPTIINALKNDSSLPPYTVAITFDGAHKSLFDWAAPILKQYNLPYTIFVAPQNLEENSNSYMSWKDLKKLSKDELVTIGLHPARYERLAGDDEVTIRQKITTALVKVREELDLSPVYFSYPFGEYSTHYRNAVASMAFEAAFTQNSGTAHGQNDIYALPRFTMTETYGDLQRFRMTATALPLPIDSQTPNDPYLETATPDLELTIDESLTGQVNNLSCFISGHKKPKQEIIGVQHIKLIMDEPLSARRIRINCTLPVKDHKNPDNNRWRWFGRLLTLPATTEKEIIQEQLP